MSLGHSILAFKNINKGIGKLETNVEILAKELDSHWEVLAEPI